MAIPPQRDLRDPAAGNIAIRRRDVNSDVPESRRQRRRTRTRAALLTAAAELFTEKGVDATTVAAIAERADVGYGSLYNYFDGLEDIIEVLAAESVQRILVITETIMTDVTDHRLLPCVGARVILRSFLRDPVMRWMLERPYVFTNTFQRGAEPFMVRFESPGIRAGVLTPAAGHQSWVRTLPWILLSELNYAIEHPDGDPIAEEESLARICMRLLGVPDDDADELLTQSLRLVDERMVQHSPS
jgi:AcrR family transcriptional regulator